MKELIEQILEYHRLKEDFNRHENFVLRVQPPRPNELEIRKRGERIFVGEATNFDYWLIRQDLTYSPEMEFEMIKGGLWVPTYLKEPHKPGRKSIEYINGCREVREVRLRNQVRFAKAWSEKLSARDYRHSLLRRVHFWNESTPGSITGSPS